MLIEEDQLQQRGALTRMDPGRLGVSGAAEFTRSSKCNATNLSKQGILSLPPGFCMDLGHVPSPIQLISEGAAAHATASF